MNTPVLVVKLIPLNVNLVKFENTFIKNKEKILKIIKDSYMLDELDLNNGIYLIKYKSAFVLLVFANGNLVIDKIQVFKKKLTFR